RPGERGQVRLDLRRDLHDCERRHREHEGRRPRLPHPAELGCREERLRQGLPLMRERPLGRTGLRVSEIGFGAWAIGGGLWGGPRDDDARAALARAVEQGVSFIDTALVYGNGHSEALVGELVRAHPHVAVATKVPPKNYQWPARPRTPLEKAFPADWIV